MYAFFTSLATPFIPTYIFLITVAVPAIEELPVYITFPFEFINILESHCSLVGSLPRPNSVVKLTTIIFLKKPISFNTVDGLIEKSALS